MYEYIQPRFAAPGLTSKVSADLVAIQRTDGFGIPFGLVLLFLIALYCQVALQVPDMENLGLMNIIGGGAIAAVIVQVLLNRGSFELVWPESFLVIAFVIAAGLSCIGALWMRYAVDNTLDLLKYVSLYFLILHTVNNVGRFRVLLWTMVLAALFPALGTLNNYRIENLVEGRAAWIGIFANPNEMAYTLVILVPLVAYLAVTSPPLVRILLVGILAIYTAAVYVTFSRGGILGLLVVGALLGLKWRSKSGLTLTVILLGASFAFLAYGWTRGDGFTELSSDLNFQQRLATFQAGFSMFLDHPLTGVGLGCSLIAWPLYAPPDLYTRGSLIIHNTFVQTLSETGLIGFCCFVLLLIAALRRARGIAWQDPGVRLRTGRLGSALEVSLWGFIVCGLSGGYALTWFPYLLIALVSSADSFTRVNESRDSTC